MKVIGLNNLSSGARNYSFGLQGLIEMSLDKYRKSDEKLDNK